MKLTTRVLTALMLGVYITTNASTSIAYAIAENTLPIIEEEEDASEVTHEEPGVIELDDEAELDPSLYIDDEFGDEEDIDEDIHEDEISADDGVEYIGDDSEEDTEIEEIPELTESEAEADKKAEAEIDENATESENAAEPIKAAEESESLEDLFPPAEEDVEVELEGLFNCDGNHYETKSKNVSYYNKATKGRVKKGTISAKGSVVKVVDTKYSGAWLISDKYYKLSNGYWVLAKNLKSHDCTGGNRTTTYERSVRSGDNKYHNVVKSVSAQKCTKCGCVMKKATKDTSKEKHSDWYGCGYCGVCNYKFKINEKDIKKAEYMVTTDLYLRKEPYSAAATKGSLIKSGTVITINVKAENAHENLWYKTTDGGWVYSGNVEKHSHSYSSTTGKCSCGELYSYEKTAVSRKAYQVKSGKVSAYNDPYTGSTVKKTYEENTVFYVNAYSYSDPNAGWLSRGDKWFRTTDGYWVLSSKVKEHTDKHHNYTADSAGKCTFSGCTGEYELDVKWIHLLNHKADTYETKKANKVARIKPYSGTTVKCTYEYARQVVRVDRYVKNANGEIWYRTTDGYWIKETDIKIHSHALSAGACTSVDCGYAVNIGLKSMSAKLYETNADNVPVKDTPFDDARTDRALNESKGIKLNGYTTKLNEKWYRTTDGKYVKARYVTEHVHSYKNGYCAVCGQYAKYTTQSIDSKIVETTKAGITILDKPYDKAKIKRTLASKGEKIIITEQAINYYNNVWYKVSTGGWVYSGNVKALSGGEIKVSNKSAVQNYIITVTDNKNNPISNASIEWLGQTYKANENGNIELIYVTDKTEFTISAPDYDSVTKKDYTMNKNHRDSVTLALTGSFEAINVNMTYVGETTDLLKTARSINHYHTQPFWNRETITIKCVMGDTTSVGKYKLVQGKKVVAESTNGKFENLKPKSFEANKSVELQVFDKNGDKQATQKLLLNVFNVTDTSVSNGVSLGATDLSFKFASGVPLIGGLEFSFDLKQTLGITVDIGDESTMLMFNFANTKDDDGNFKYTNTAASYKQFFKELKECTSSTNTYFYRKYAGDSPDLGKWKGGFKGIRGYAEKIHGEDVYKGKLYIEFNLKMENWTQLWAGPVPFVLEIEIEGVASPNGSITLTNGKLHDGKIGLDLSATVDASIGVGIKYVASLSIYGKAGLYVEADILPISQAALNNIYLNGTLGIKAKVLDMEIANLHIFDHPNIYIVQNGKWVLWEADTSLYDVITDANSYVSIDRGYLENRSGWYTEENVGLFEDTEGDQEISIVVSDFDFDVLQSSTYTDIRPQVVTADGTIMMVYNDDNEARADVDKSMLVYSLYNPESKEWSVPVPVNDDTTADYGFAVCSSNDEIYIVWQNAKSLNNPDATLTEISKNTELYIAKYDAAMGSFQHIEQVTDNEKYELMPKVASVNGKTIVSWYVNDQDDVFVTDGNNTVEYAFKYDEDYAPRQEYVVDVSDMTDEDLEEEILPSDDGEVGDEEVVYPTQWTYGTVATVNEAITSLAVGYMLDESYIAYTTDADKNTATVTDQYIWLYDTQTEELSAYTDKASNVEFTTVHGDNAMTWYNQGMIYYALDPEYAPQKLYTEQTNLGDEYHIISDDAGNMAILFTVKNDESSDAYLMLYDFDTMEWGLPIAVTNQDKYIENFNGAYSDGMIVSIFNQVQITDEEMNETNNLCSAVIGERHDVSISNASFKDFELEPGATKPLTVDVKNNGTLRISEFTINVYNGEEVVSQQTVEKVLKTGETTSVELEITLPEVLEKTTYVVEIEEIGYDDAYYADNSKEVVVGRAALVVTAESTPTDTENIVVVTVENSGYEPAGGMIALFDDQNQVKEVLIENFDPIDHGEYYTCAIKLSDEYFEGASGKTFSIGVVPSAEQDIDAYNIDTVYVDNINHDNLPDIEVSGIDLVESAGEVSLMEEPAAKSITGKVKNESEEDIENAEICVVTYDDRGVYLGMTYLDTVSLAAGEEAEFTATFDSMENISIIKVMLINGDGFEPLSSAVEIRIHDDLTDEGEGIDESDEYDAIISEEE